MEKRGYIGIILYTKKYSEGKSYVSDNGKI